MFSLALWKSEKAPAFYARYVAGVVTYREEPPRDISIATRLRVRDKPDPHSFGCRATPTVTAATPRERPPLLPADLHHHPPFSRRRILFTLHDRLGIGRWLKDGSFRGILFSSFSFFFFLFSSQDIIDEYIKSRKMNFLPPYLERNRECIIYSPMRLFIHSLVKIYIHKSRDKKEPFNNIFIARSLPRR